jgi:hypothetical protein
VNAPYRVGERWRCFVVVREDKGWGYQIRGDLSQWEKVRMADHHDCGHAPCPKCGVTLLRRKDGSPRQHAHNRCPGKDPGDKIELEFVKNMSEREYA